MKIYLSDPLERDHGEGIHAAGRTFDLNERSGRAAFDEAIRTCMKEAGLSYSAATAHLSDLATFGDESTTPNVNDQVTRAKLHTEAIRRVEESKKNAAGSGGRIKEVSFSDALGSIFDDLARGEKVEGFS